MKQMIASNYRSMDRIYIFSTVILLVLGGFVYTANAQVQQSQLQTQSQVSQQFNQALQLYQQNNYRQAAAIFDSLSTDEAHLFSGKSYFSLGQFNKALYYLNLVSPQADPSVVNETKYTLGLVEFQLHDFTACLDHMYELAHQQNSNQLPSQAGQFYNQVLEYLTLNQRMQVFTGSKFPRVKYDVINSAINKVTEPTAMSLLHAAEETFGGSPDSTFYNSLNNKISHYNFTLVNSNNMQLKAPDGISYTLGVALPAINKQSDEYKASRNLFYGISYAVDQFNRAHPNMKVFTRYEDTAGVPDSVDAMSDLAWKDHADMIIGPLTSEKAAAMSGSAELYQIPLIPPLANSDTLSSDNPYLFQANPTMAVRGKKMADFAVNQQHYNHLAVIAQKNSWGEAQAIAFRDEAARLGATVDYFFLEDFQKQGYNVSPYTQYFNPDTMMVDSLHSKPVDAIYLPFTGLPASTLINAVITDFQAFNARIPILGNQEWPTVNLSPENIRGMTIYYSSPGAPQEGSDAMNQFRTGFKDRYQIDATQLSITGYDVASYLLQILNQVQNPALLKEAIKTAPIYNGLGGHYYFNGSHVNQAVNIYQLNPNNSTLIQTIY